MTRTRIDRAIELAAIAHGDQKYGDLPYLAHLMQVAMQLQADGHDEDVVVAGILHDIVEDTNVSPATIAHEFGSKVAAIVAGMTKFDGEDYEDYIDRLPLAAVPVKLADSGKNLAGLYRANMTEGRKAKLRARYQRNLDLLAQHAAS